MITVVNAFVVCILHGVAESKNNVLVYNFSRRSSSIWAGGAEPHQNIHPNHRPLYKMNQ